ncbi:hydrogenase expression protein [Streptomyces sp. NPDC050610]|uniref:hydrogenase expression protein n=1 Tax=Streptomyces sp. NPDC050610 TaxID=3157097 RepID=UPI003412B98C
MSMWTSLEPAATSVDPGSSAGVRLRVRNTGDTVEEYRLSLVGDAAGWGRVEPDVLRLYPGAEGTAQVDFAPPRTSDAKAGPVAFGVRVLPREQPQAADVAEGQITVGAFAEMNTDLIPLVVRGRWRATAQVAVDNLGNQPLTTSFSTRDNGDSLSVDPDPGAVQVAPGRAGFALLRIKAGSISWVGGTRKHPFTLSVLRAGVAQPTELRGTYVQPSILPRWLMAILGVLLALLMIFLVLWFQHKPSVSTQAREKAGELTKLPQGEMSKAPSPPPSQEPTSTPTPDKHDDDGDKKKGDGGGGGGGGHKKPAGPKLFTIKDKSGTGWYLQANEGKQENGTQVGQNPKWTGDQFGKNQMWILHHYKDDNTYALESASAPGAILDKLVNPDGFHTNLLQIMHAKPEDLKTGNLRVNQKWRLVDAPGDEGRKRIVSVDDGSCVFNMANDKGATTQGCDNHSADNMAWMIVPK